MVVCFAGKKGGPFATADDMIVSAVGRLAKNGALVTVVTSDRQLQRRSRFAALRFPSCRLQIVPSPHLADWLLQHPSTSSQHHPYVSAFHPSRHDDKDDDEWLKDAPHPKGRRKLSIVPQQRGAGVEGTPSRVQQAAGLYNRITRWLEDDSQHSESSYPWLQDLLDRYPW